MRLLKQLFARTTSTSLEIVELLNALRSDSEPRLRHDHFTRKVPKVLGAKAERFAATYTTHRGLQRCYVFPMREACLMVMSYGYELQARIFDQINRSRR